MIIASHTGSSNNIYYLWYVLSFLEAAAILTASGKWKALGFRKTHLLERIGLLSMIVVGEGVIGVTKTIGKLMGSAGPDIRSVQQVISIIAVLVIYSAVSILRWLANAFIDVPLADLFRQPPTRASRHNP